MTITPAVLWPIFEPGDETHQLFDGFFVSFLALFSSSQFRVAQDAGLTVAAGPGDQGGGAGCKEVNPIEGAFFFVEADRAALDPIFADIVTGKIKVKRGFQFTGVG